MNNILLDNPSVKQPKYLEVASLLRKRIQYGDYMLNDLPAERVIAKEMGVSSFTIRKACDFLIKRNLLTRKLNGRLCSATENSSQASTAQIALLVPSFFSRHSARWCNILEAVAEEYGVIVRPIMYRHWDDPIFSKNFETFAGVFLVPFGGEVPQRLIETLKLHTPPIVILDANYSASGIPSLVMFNPSFVHILLDHLAKLGHRRIDCINIQPTDSLIEARTSQWNLWRAACGLPGEFYNYPVPERQQRSVNIFEYSRETVKKILSDGDAKRTAIFCTTGPCAIGALRACYELDLPVGKDISICTIDTEGQVRSTCPSITALEDVDPSPYLKVCLEWILRDGKDWIGPLWMQPSAPNLFIGESTGSVR